MSHKDKKICKIQDPRLAGYTNRTRSGSHQVFYTGNDSRDFDRYHAEGGASNHSVKMHDKPDTIQLEPSEKHHYAELIDGEWWWLNGCAECNGNPRDWMTYIECDKHNVCRSCRASRSEITEPPWGGKSGWQCVPCANAEKAALKLERLQAMAAKEYDEWDYQNQDEVICPHCEYSFQPDSDDPDGSEQCEVCDGEYTVDTEYSRTFSTTVVGERVVA